MIIGPDHKTEAARDFAGDVNFKNNCMEKMGKHEQERKNTLDYNF